MHSQRSLQILSLVTAAFAARPFLNEPDTGIELAIQNLAQGTLPPLDDMVGLHDFEWAARNYLNATHYNFYRAGAGGEWSYRNNLESYSRLRFRPQVLEDVTDVQYTLPTQILGYNVSAPFFITSCGRAGYAHPDGELNLAKAATSENVLYVPSLHGTKSIEEIYAAVPNTTTPFFQQLYLSSTNMTDAIATLRRAEAVGAKALLLTVDSAADGNRQRAARWDVTSSDSGWESYTWQFFQQMQNLTSLPIIPKGIQSVQAAQKAVKAGCKAIYLSNHGGRQTDYVPSSLETVLEIKEEAPEIFDQIEVWADGGVRYGSDVLKLLALGVKAVGVGRPFIYANTFGTDGVVKAVQMLKKEVALDASNIGVKDIQKIDDSFVKKTNSG